MALEESIINIKGTGTVMQELIDVEEAEIQRLESERMMFHSSLAGYIANQYQTNKDARKTSGIEEKIFESSRAYNGEYSKDDLTRIKAAGGSRIFMNLTATKCRAACSWIRDILQSAKFKPYALEPTPLPELQEGVSKAIDEAVDTEWGELAVQEGGAQGAQQSVRDSNQIKRDLKDAVLYDIQSQAKYELKKIELLIDDELAEGGWDEALGQFIEDFTVYPTAFMKGPVISKSKRLSWIDGKAEAVSSYQYGNRRISPLDMYPSPDATSIQDGNLIEHIRMSRSELQSLIGVENYKSDIILQILEEFPLGASSSSMGVTSDIESDKAEEELRGSSTDANTNVLHGLHYFGSVPARTLKVWGLPIEEEDTTEIQVEAIVVENKVIKCIINNDPLLRRPYYKASWQNVPGSFWGRSLPALMSSEQRMCNATARALANNMGIASGPQVEIYVDRIADAGDIEEITPMKIWQMQSDPSGAGGRAITWHQPSSNANELLAVYKEFESKADDSTGIPRYAYSNEKVGGAATTAAGMSMLLEASSKGIKDAVRHVDSGLIKPRLEYQFYWHMKANDTGYTGDINVVVTGSSALTVKGAEQLRRNEFLQVTNNEVDMKIMGVEGRAALLREMALDLNLPDLIPSSLELKKTQKEEEAKQAEAAKAEQEQGNKQTEAVQIQTQGQIQMHQGTLQSKQVDQQLKNKKIDTDAALDGQRLQLDAAKAESQDNTNREAITTKENAQKREIALALTKGEGI